MKIRYLITLVVGIAVVVAGYLALRKLDAPSDDAQNTVEEVKRLQANNILHNGDIIFQSSMSGQSKAIQLATHSRYSHCGIVVLNGGKAYVVEAVQPVSITPLARWIGRGDDGH